MNDHFDKSVSCMCGSTKKYGDYVACTNYEGQLRATKCKCFKNKLVALPTVAVKAVEMIMTNIWQQRILISHP